MTPAQLAAIPRKSIREIIASVPLGPGIDDRLNIAIESAMNIEWWRGYYAGLRKTKENVDE